MKAARNIGLACLCAWIGTASSAPITFNTALPVHEGGWVVREQFLYMKNADDPSQARRDMRVSGVVSMAGYGVRRDVALFGMLPYLDKRLDMDMGGMHVGRSRQGTGDLTLLGRYTAHENNGPGQTLRVAPFFGIKVPTGNDHGRDGKVRLPPPLQSGSGSWDLMGGAVVTYQTLDFQIDSQASYQANREANGFRAGNIARADASLQYRLWPRLLGAGVPAFLYGVLEANLIHAAKDRFDGAGDPNSGGTTLFFSPGLQYVAKKWIVEAGIQIPVVQRLNGAALKNDYALNAGIRINF